MVSENGLDAIRREMDTLLPSDVLVKFVGNTPNDFGGVERVIILATPDGVFEATITFYTRPNLTCEGGAS